jgi:hypothetical protein
VGELSDHSRIGRPLERRKLVPGKQGGSVRAFGHSPFSRLEVASQSRLAR